MPSVLDFTDDQSRTISLIDIIAFVGVHPCKGYGSPSSLLKTYGDGYLLAHVTTMGPIKLLSTCL